MQWLRNLLGMKTEAETRAFGAEYVDSVLAANPGCKESINRLWAECDPSGFDSGHFDKGMRDRLLELKIPHPLDTPE